MTTAEIAPPPPSRMLRLREAGRILWGAVDFLLSNEVYTWASAIAFNALITFFPLMILLHSLARTLDLPGLAEHILFVVRAYMPVSKDFISGTIRDASMRMGAVTWVSFLVLAVTAGGIFLPIEIALNQIWKVDRARHWAVSLAYAYGLTILGALLFAVPVSISWGFSEVLQRVFFFLSPDDWILQGIETIFLRIVALPFTILLFLSCYALLPARRMHLREILPPAVFTGLLLELGRWLFIASLPLFDFRDYYGAFFVTVTLVTFALYAAMLMLFGAYLTAQDLLPKRLPDRIPWGRERIVP